MPRLGAAWHAALAENWPAIVVALPLLVAPCAPAACYLLLCGLGPALLARAWQRALPAQRGAVVVAFAPVLAALLLSSALRPGSWPGAMWLAALLSLACAAELEPCETSRRRCAAAVRAAGAALAAAHLWRFLLGRQAGELWYQEVEAPLAALALSPWRWPELAALPIVAALPLAVAVPREGRLAAAAGLGEVLLLAAGLAAANPAAGGCAALVAFAWLAWRTRRGRALAVVLALAAIVAGAGLGAVAAGGAKAAARVGLAAAEQRVYAWRVALAVFERQPLVGCGPGLLPVEHGPSRPSPPREAYQAVARPPSISGAPVTWVAETGVVGALALLWLSWATISTWRRAGPQPHAQRAPFAAAALGAAAYATLTDGFFSGAAGAVVFALVFGLARARTPHEQAEGHEPSRAPLAFGAALFAAAALALALGPRLARPLPDLYAPEQVARLALRLAAEGELEAARPLLERAATLFPPRWAALERRAPPAPEELAQSLDLGAKTFSALARCAEAEGDEAAAQAWRAAAEQVGARAGELRAGLSLGDVGGRPKPQADHAARGVDEIRRAGARGFINENFVKLARARAGEPAEPSFASLCRGNGNLRRTKAALHLLAAHRHGKLRLHGCFRERSAEQPDDSLVRKRRGGGKLLKLLAVRGEKALRRAVKPPLINNARHKRRSAEDDDCRDNNNGVA